MRALQPRLDARDRESGFSLIEVLVSIVILGIIATAGLNLYITAIESATTIQERDVAITVVNESLEGIGARSIAATVATGQSALLAGRTQSAVTTAWTSNASASGVSDTYPLWDTAASSSSVPAVPITRQVTRNGTVFTATALIGSCYQPRAGGDCEKVSGASASSTPAGYVALFRVIVVVSWNSGASCAGGNCFYEGVTLLDPNTDLLWNTNV